MEDTRKTELCAPWIKVLPLEQELTVADFAPSKSFVKVANIVMDKERNTNGKKARLSLIRFDSIDDELWKKDNEWLYMFVVGGKIVKLGGTRVSLKDRVSSYLCGHHVKERGKSGKCSITNAYIYNTFDFYLRNGYTIEMFGYMLPRVEVPIKVLDEEILALTQSYHIYEAKYLREYKKQTGHYPCLSDNADPVHS